MNTLNIESPIFILPLKEEFKYALNVILVKKCQYLNQIYIKKMKSKKNIQQKTFCQIFDKK
jgi:hypothetical protein